MVYKASALAAAVLAFSAASTLAAPLDFSSQNLVERDVEDLSLDAREMDYDFDAREFEYDFEEARELGDFEYDAREFYDFDELVERQASTSSTSATSTSSSSSSTIGIPSATTTTIVTKPTGTSKKETTHVIKVIHRKGKTCYRPTALERLRTMFSDRTKLPSIEDVQWALKTDLKDPKSIAKSAVASSTSGTPTPTNILAGAAAFAQITPPPKANWAKGIKIKENKRVRGGTTTITRTITTAPTCLPKRQRNKRRDFDDLVDVIERNLASFDELD